MVPMIRVDNDVYEFLNSKGRTEDTFNDVLRRELGLAPKKTRKTLTQEAINRIEGSRKHGEDGFDPNIILAMNKYLPDHWDASKEQEEQILRVVLSYLGLQDSDLSERERYIAAVRDTAQLQKIEPETVRDKCTRRLYGQGRGLTDQFCAALKKIERDL